MPRVSPARQDGEQSEASPTTDDSLLSPALSLNREYSDDELFRNRKAWFAPDLAPEFQECWTKNGGVALDSINLFQKEVCVHNILRLMRFCPDPYYGTLFGTDVCQQRINENETYVDQVIFRYYFGCLCWKDRGLFSFNRRKINWFHETFSKTKLTDGVEIVPWRRQL